MLYRSPLSFSDESVVSSEKINENPALSIVKVCLLILHFCILYNNYYNIYYTNF